MKFNFNFLKRNKWETVFSGEVVNRSKDGKLVLQVERAKNKYRVFASTCGQKMTISLSKIISTFPEVIPILTQENIKE